MSIFLPVCQWAKTNQFEWALDDGPDVIALLVTIMSALRLTSLARLGLTPAPGCEASVCVWAYLDDNQQRAFTAKCLATDSRWPHLPRCGDWPGWCHRWPLPPVSGLGLSWWGSGAGPHSWCHWPHHEYIREFLSETISVATDLRSHNECIEWSKNI